MTDLRKLDQDDIPLAPIALKDGDAVTLRCRTPGEAYLICDQLESEDVLTILPDEEELLARFKRDGYVEVRVSAKAYESLGDLKSTVEFQYKQLKSEQRLPLSGKLLAMLAAMMIVPGAILFALKLSNFSVHD